MSEGIRKWVLLPARRNVRCPRDREQSVAAVAVDRLEELVSSIGRDLPAGGGALALTVDALRDPEVVTDRLQLHRDGLTRVQIPASLREEIERHALASGLSAKT